MKNSIGVMAFRGNPSPTELKNWASGIGTRSIDVVLEYLHTKKCLNKERRDVSKRILGGFYKR